MSQIAAENRQDTLYLTGELDVHSLDNLWQNQQTLLHTITTIDVTGLARVDSAGLAILVYFCNHYHVKLIGISIQLQKLIDLYDLQPVLDAYP